jgi:hypothetical protein
VPTHEGTGHGRAYSRRTGRAQDTIAMAVLRSGTTECDERVIPNTPEALRRLLARYPDRSGGQGPDETSSAESTVPSEP